MTQAATPADRFLPPGFADLEPWVAAWALPTEQARCAKRLGARLEELRAFHAAILPRMDAAMRHLAGFPADDIATLPGPTRELYRLVLSYFEVSNPVELKWKGPDLDNAFPASRIVYRAPSDLEN